MIWIFNIPHQNIYNFFCVRFQNNSILVLVHLFWINSLNQGGIFFFIIKKFTEEEKKEEKRKAKTLILPQKNEKKKRPTPDERPNVRSEQRQQ